MNVMAKVCVNSAQLKVTLMCPLDRYNALSHTQKLSATLSVPWHKIKKMDIKSRDSRCMSHI
jgi:hypothetical protein